MTITEARPEAMTGLTTSAKALGEFLKNATVYASADRARPAINAVRVEIEDGKVRTVSTDSYVLLVQEWTVADAQATDPFEISVETIKDWVKILGTAQGPASFGLVGNVAELHAHGLRLHALTGETGRFPNYQQLIPDPAEYRIEGAAPAPAMNPKYLAFMSKLTIPGYTAKWMKTVPVRLRSLSATRCSVWTLAGTHNAQDYTATILQMPVRVD